MIAKKNFIDTILHVCSIAGDDRLFSILYVLKTITAIIIFIAVVIVWDTLPSTAPLSDIKQSISVSQDGHVTAKYDAVVRKLVDFDLQYTFVHMENGISLSDHVYHARDNARIPYNISLATTPHHLEAKGNWCLLSKLTWENGLSIRSHHTTLETVCFEL